MKKSLILILILSSWQFCFSQNWGANNAVWYYTQLEFMEPPLQSYIKYTSIGDTVILGDTAVIIKREYESKSTNYMYMKSNNNRVYLFVPSLNDYRLIYDFNAVAGDTIQVFCIFSDFENKNISIVVDSVSDININGNILKMQHVSQACYFEDCFMHGAIIENIGWTGFMFPLHVAHDPPYGGPLRCYEDDLIGLYKIVDFDCDYIANIEYIECNNNFYVYPNPIQQSFIIETDLWHKSNAEIRITTTTGNHIKTKPINSPQTEINTSGWSKGTYICSLYVGSRFVESRRIVVE